jgi:hypothetical protein
MNVIGGFNNDTASQLTSLINKASGGVTDAIGGVSLSNNNPVQLSTGQGDIRVSAYA